MPTGSAAAWDRRAGPWLSSEIVQYGPDIGTEADYRLFGRVEGKRVLELGCAGGHATIAFARQGAHAIGVDASHDLVTAARRRAEREEVRVELHRADLADLAFVRADTIDFVFSAYAFGQVADLSRVFRQVHRVLKTGAPLVFSVPHPAYDMIEETEGDGVRVRRSYFDRQPVDYELDGLPLTDHHRTISDLVTALVRANFHIDTLLEPEPADASHHSPFWTDAFRWAPRTLVVRARKEGL